MNDGHSAALPEINMTRFCPPFVFLICALTFCVLPGQVAQQPVIDEPLAPQEAARTMVVPEGFHVSLFAGEPDVKQPIGFCIDDRGRLWVAEAYNYPNHGTTPGDRIVILADTDNDGRFDKRTVFYDKLNYVTGIEVGFGGAWVMSPPFFYFIPDRDGDDIPDAAPQVLLDGFGNHANAHNLANGFAWGPDGWLYGTHGRTNWSLIGKPGTPEAERVRYDGGVYRYHPMRHVWEPYADGTTNPWGIDWNDFGEAFVCNCVNPHLFHVIYGAHYEPWRNRESSLYAYERIPTIADHLHFIGGNDIRYGLGSTEEDEAGGGHAHCGTMVYLGDNWPERYRNTIFMNNIHGRRINNDIPRRAGSGYLAAHGPDIMRSKDTWFMGVTLAYGPDGGVFVSDWSDTGECHSVKNTRRHTGRIYKLTYGDRPAAPIDITRLGDLDLARLQSHRNDWYVRHARRLLHEHFAAGTDMAAVRNALHAMYAEETDVPRRLRALWALYVIDGANADFLARQLSDRSEYIRSWALRLLCESGSPSTSAVSRFRELAATDPSPLVRLHLASMLQRLAPAERWTIAEALLTHAEDAADANLPLMVWYAVEPLVNENLERFIALAGDAKIPLVRRHIARRVAELTENRQGLNSLTRLLGGTDDDVRTDLLAGLLQGLAGRRSVTIPAGWAEVYSQLSQSRTVPVREQSLELALLFDDPVALATLRSQAVDANAPVATRNRAIQALVNKKHAQDGTLLLKLVKDPATRNAALRGLAEYDPPGAASAVLEQYASFDGAARQDAVQTLASRPAWALALLDAVEKKHVPRSDLSAFTARQLLNLRDARVAERVKSLWGEVRATAADKTRQIADLKRRLTPESLERADRSAGRAIFQKTCANCHKLFDAGGAIGPDLTGSQRTNLDYLLENMIDPSASVARDFQMQIIETTAGRVITGLVTSESKVAVTIQTANEKIVVPASEIERRTTADVSMMPDGMLKDFSTDQIRNLIAYLSGPTQVTLNAP
jgi:putative membrane-bound dehydrogenase-like protein